MRMQPEWWKALGTGYASCFILVGCRARKKEESRMTTHLGPEQRGNTKLPPADMGKDVGKSRFIERMRISMIFIEWRASLSTQEVEQVGRDTNLGFRRRMWASM
jgi:hypothetical protein